MASNPGGDEYKLVPYYAAEAGDDSSRMDQRNTRRCQVLGPLYHNSPSEWDEDLGVSAAPLVHASAGSSLMPPSLMQPITSVGGAVFDTVNPFPMGSGRELANDMRNELRMDLRRFRIPLLDAKNPDNVVDTLGAAKVLELRENKPASDMLDQGKAVLVQFPYDSIKQHHKFSIRITAKAPYTRLSQLIAAFPRDPESNTVAHPFAPLEVPLLFQHFKDHFRAACVLQDKHYHVVPHEITLTAYCTQGLPGFRVHLSSSTTDGSGRVNWVEQSAVDSSTGAMQSVALLPNTSKDNVDKLVYVGNSSLVCTPAWCRWAPVNMEEELSRLQFDAGTQCYIIRVISDTVTKAVSPIEHDVMRCWDRIYPKIERAIEEGRAPNLALKSVRGHPEVHPVVDVSTSGQISLRVPKHVLDAHMARKKRMTDVQRHFMSLDGVVVSFVPDVVGGWNFLHDKYDIARLGGPLYRDPQIQLSVTFTIEGALSPVRRRAPRDW